MKPVTVKIEPETLKLALEAGLASLGLIGGARLVKVRAYRTKGAECDVGATLTLEPKSKETK